MNRVVSIVTTNLFIWHRILKQFVKVKMSNTGKLKVSKPASPALEELITKTFHKKATIQKRFKSVQHLIDAIPPSQFDKVEVVDGIKDMANRAKLNIGTSNQLLGHKQKRKYFHERSFFLSIKSKNKVDTEKENLSTRELKIKWKKEKTMD